MTHIAVMLTRAAGEWSAAEVDVLPDDDLEAIGDRVADSDDTVELAVLFLEENDEWFAVARWDDVTAGASDPRVFVSDRRVFDDSELARRLFADTLPIATPEDADDDAGRPEIEPAGDEALLADVGASGDRLIGVAVEEGLLPADSLAAIAELVGAAEPYESARLA